MPLNRSTHPRRSVSRRARIWKFERLESRAMLAAVADVGAPFIDLIPANFNSDTIASVTNDTNDRTNEAPVSEVPTNDAPVNEVSPNVESAKEAPANEPPPDTELQPASQFGPQVSHPLDPALPVAGPVQSSGLSQATDDAMASTDQWTRENFSGENPESTPSPLDQAEPTEEPPREDEVDKTITEGESNNETDKPEGDVDPRDPNVLLDPGADSSPSIELHNSHRSENSRPGTIALLAPATNSDNQIAERDASEDSPQSRRSLFTYFVTTNQSQMSGPSLRNQPLGREVTHDTYMTLSLLTSRSDATAQEDRAAHGSRGQHRAKGTRHPNAGAADQIRLAESSQIAAPVLSPETQAAIEKAMTELQSLDLIVDDEASTTNVLGSASSLAEVKLVATSQSMDASATVPGGADANNTQRPWMWGVFTVTSLMLTSQNLRRTSRRRLGQRFDWLKLG